MTWVVGWKIDDSSSCIDYRVSSVALQRLWGRKMTEQWYFQPFCLLDIKGHVMRWSKRQGSSNPCVLSFHKMVEVDVEVYAYFSGSVAKLGWLLMQCVGNAYQHIVGYYITKNAS